MTETKVHDILREQIIGDPQILDPTVYTPNLDKGKNFKLTPRQFNIYLFQLNRRYNYVEYESSCFFLPSEYLSGEVTPLYPLKPVQKDGISKTMMLCAPLQINSKLTGCLQKH